MKPRGNGWARGIGLLLGLSLAVGLVLSSRIPLGIGVLGTDLVMSSAPTGELAVEPIGPFANSTGMQPGRGGVEGTLEVLNQTGKALQVRLRGLPSRKDLDGLLWVQVEVAGRRVFRGPLGELREWTEAAFGVASGQGKTVQVRAWLPANVESGYEGRIETLGLEFLAEPVGG